MLIKLILTLQIYCTIHRIRIKNLLNNEYLRRGNDKVELTSQPQSPKTDFFVDLSRKKGNRKQAVLYERVRNKNPRYLVYKKDANELGYQDNPYKFTFIYQKNVFNISTGKDECLHVMPNNQIRLMKCNTKSMNQKFTFKVLNKKQHKKISNEKMSINDKNKSKERMLIDVEGKDYKKKDKMVHEDNVLIKYSDDESSISSTNDDATGDGSYKVSEEVLTDTEEEPAILKTDHVSKVLHSTLYTTVIVNSTSTVYSTVYHTETSSIIGKKTDLVTIDPSYISEIKPVRQIRPKTDEELNPVANVNTKKYNRITNMFKKPFRWNKKKKEEIKIPDDSTETEHLCDNLNLEECRKLSENDLEMPMRRKDRKMMNKSNDIKANTLHRRYDKDDTKIKKNERRVKLRNDIMQKYFEEPKISDFIDDIPDMDLKNFLGTEKSKENILKKDNNINRTDNNINRTDNNINKTDNNINKTDNNQENLKRFSTPVEKNELYKFKQKTLNQSQPIKKEIKNNKEVYKGRSESGGLLSYVGFNGPIENEFAESSDDDIMGGIHLDF